MLQKVEEYIKRNNLLENGAKVVIGVSGGADSVALLDILLKLGYECIAAHCNFHLRDEESNRDMDFVTKICRNYNIPLRIIDFDTEEYAMRHSVSIEMAARELRYAWFEGVRKENGATAIIVAHHQDDSVETILLNLVRGTGIRGLTGIPSKNGYIVRPLLCLSRHDVLDYLWQQNLSFVDDRTNKEDIYTRNKIRLKVIPLLETINPSVKTSINITAQHLCQVASIYRSYIEQAEADVFKDNKICIDKLLTYLEPKAVLFEILHRHSFNGATIEQIFGSIHSQSGKIFYSETHKVIKDRQFLLLDELKSEDCATSFAIKEFSNEITHPIHLKIDRTEGGSVRIEKNSCILYLNADIISYPLILRRWKKGDWFIPFGMKGRKKVSDYFSDNKFSLIDKENIWLLCNGDDIVWIVGHRSDDRYRIDGEQKTILKIILSPKSY